MPKIETKVTYNNRPIQRLNTCARHSFTVNSQYTEDHKPISFLGFDVYIYDEGNESYPGDYLIFVDKTGEVKGVLNINTDDGIRGLDFQIP